MSKRIKTRKQLYEASQSVQSHTSRIINSRNGLNVIDVNLAFNIPYNNRYNFLIWSCSHHSGDGKPKLVAYCNDPDLAERTAAYITNELGATGSGVLIAMGPEQYHNITVIYVCGGGGGG